MDRNKFKRFTSGLMYFMSGLIYMALGLQPNSDHDMQRSRTSLSIEVGMVFHLVGSGVSKVRDT